MQQCAHDELLNNQTKGHVGFSEKEAGGKLRALYQQTMIYDRQSDEVAKMVANGCMVNCDTVARILIHMPLHTGI